MKALVKSKPEKGLWMENVPEPTVGDRDVLIRVKKTAICGTDVNIYNWGSWSQRVVKTPCIVGHEFMGEVVEVGSQVWGIAPSDRVCAEGHLTCGHCRSCKTGKRHLCPNTQGIGYHVNGAFADLIAMPAENIFPIPDSIPDDVAAIFDPFGNTVHTALSTDLVGENVLITGAGPLGIMAAAVARFAGAAKVVVTDVNPTRLALATKMGATQIVNVAEEELTKEQEFTVGMEMSGRPEALAAMLQSMYPGGHIALLGLLPTDADINWEQVIFKEITLRGIYGREIFGTWHKMSELVQSGLDISPVITHRFPAEEFEKGFAAIHDGSAAKVILDWT